MNELKKFRFSSVSARKLKCPGSARNLHSSARLEPENSSSSSSLQYLCISSIKPGKIRGKLWTFFSMIISRLWKWHQSIMIMRLQKRIDGPLCNIDQKINIPRFPCASASKCNWVKSFLKKHSYFYVTDL